MLIQIIATETNYDHDDCSDSMFTTYLVGATDSKDKVYDIIKADALKAFDDGYNPDESDPEAVRAETAAKRKNLEDNLRNLEFTIKHACNSISQVNLTQVAWLDIFAGKYNTDEIKYFAIFIN